LDQNCDIRLSKQELHKTRKVLSIFSFLKITLFLLTFYANFYVFRAFSSPIDSTLEMPLQSSFGLVGCVQIDGFLLGIFDSSFLAILTVQFLLIFLYNFLYFQGRCNREKPPCKYFHPPQHLKDQLLINGRNHLALKNALMQHMGIAPNGQPIMSSQLQPMVNFYANFSIV
jgi:hypothetical protein